MSRTYKVRIDRAGGDSEVQVIALVGPRGIVANKAVPDISEYEFWAKRLQDAYDAGYHDGRESALKEQSRV